MIAALFWIGALFDRPKVVNEEDVYATAVGLFSEHRISLENGTI
jgi:hypothetical protein